MVDQTEQIDRLLRRGNERGRFPKTTQGNPYGNVRVSQEEQRAINESDKMLIETVQRILSDQFPDASQMPGELMDMWQFLENQKQALGEANITGNSVSFKNKMTSDARANLQRIIDMASNLPQPPMPTPSPNPIPMSRSVNPDQELIEMINASNKGPGAIITQGWPMEISNPNAKPNWLDLDLLRTKMESDRKKPDEYYDFMRGLIYDDKGLRYEKPDPSYMDDIVSKAKGE